MKFVLVFDSSVDFVNNALLHVCQFKLELQLTFNCSKHVLRILHGWW